MITTNGKNTYDKIISTRKCSEPNENLKKIFDVLNAKYRPFTRRKSVVHKPALEKMQTTVINHLPPG